MCLWVIVLVCVLHQTGLFLVFHIYCFVVFIVFSLNMNQYNHAAFWSASTSPQENPYTDSLHDDEFLTQLAYLGVVFSCLNDLNLVLQGLSATIVNVRYKIEAMIKKLELFSVCINKAQIFPSLYDLFVCK